MTDHRDSADIDAEDSAREHSITGLGLGSNLTRNDRGEWVPAIPLPYYLLWGRARCHCGEVRKSMQSYREHYALAHILGLS